MAHKRPRKLPTDKEIADGINELAKIWLTTPGLPGSASPQSPLWDPLLGGTTTTPVQGVPLTQTPWVPPGTVIPEFLRQAIQDFQFPGQTPPVPRIRSPKQRANDEIQSIALTEVNKIARKIDGTFKKGWDQKRVMIAAQKKCTKEREKRGLCKPKRSTRKGQVRKTARRAYDSRLFFNRR